MDSVFHTLSAWPSSLDNAPSYDQMLVSSALCGLPSFSQRSAPPNRPGDRLLVQLQSLSEKESKKALGPKDSADYEGDDSNKENEDPEKSKCPSPSPLPSPEGSGHSSK